MKLEQRSVKSLIPYGRNARVHSEQQIGQIVGAIREFGWTNPLLVDEGGGILAGHGRLEAARRLRMNEVPVIVLAGLSETVSRGCGGVGS